MAPGRIDASPTSRLRDAAVALLQIALLAGLYFAVDRAVAFARLPVPANVVGACVLLALLLTGVVDVRRVERGADLLLRHLVLFYVPITLTLAHERGRTARELGALVVAISVTCLVTLVVTGRVAQRLGRRGAPDLAKEARG